MILDIPAIGKFLDIFAGVETSFVKWLFLFYNRHSLQDLIQILNGRSQALQKRGKTDPEIQRMRNQAYFLEMTVSVFAFLFCLFFVIVIYLEGLFYDPIDLVVPAFYFLDLNYHTKLFWAIYIIEIALTFCSASVITLTDLMIGNLYNQIILNLEVLNYDLKVLDEKVSVSSAELMEKFRVIAMEFQSLRQLNTLCEECMRPLFINNITATMVGVVFSCVEVGIMVNLDKVRCIKPFVLFVFLNTIIFYWCWLGNRLKEKVRLRHRFFQKLLNNKDRF